MIARDGEILAVDSPESAAAMALLSAAGPNIALSGGSTPKRLYALLAQNQQLAQKLRNFHYYFGDERSVPNAHEDSNVGAALAGFLRPFQIPAEQIHRLDGGARDLASEAQRATEELLQNFPLQEGTPVFDLIFLGMGGDGHTASLFPGTEGLKSDKPGFICNQVPQLDTSRLTLTYRVLNTARHLVILAAGENKKFVLREIFERTGTPEYPIEHLNAERITWIIDHDANPWKGAE